MVAKGDVPKHPRAQKTNRGRCAAGLCEQRLCLFRRHHHRKETNFVIGDGLDRTKCLHNS